MSIKADGTPCFSAPDPGCCFCSPCPPLPFRPHPTLATWMVCCSMASWSMARSCSRMPSNSSMQHSPPAHRMHSKQAVLAKIRTRQHFLSFLHKRQLSSPSARTSAPASSIHADPSLTAVTVNPAPELPLPVVTTERRLNREANFMTWDLPGAMGTEERGKPFRLAQASDILEKERK